MRAAIYLRVSTKDQNVENQRLKLQDYAKVMGWNVVEEYLDIESGAKSARPRFKDLMAAAARREVDVILVWSLDRFSREGIGRTCEYLRALAASKVVFYSLQEPFLSTTSDTAELLTAIFAFVAGFERRRIVERVRAGLDRARHDGKTLGRPRRVFRHDVARELAAEGKSIRAIAAELGVSPMTVSRALRA